MSKVDEVNQALKNITLDRDEAVARAELAEAKISILEETLSRAKPTEKNSSLDETEKGIFDLSKLFDEVFASKPSQSKQPKQSEQPKKQDLLNPEFKTVESKRDKALMAVFGSFIHANEVNPEQIRALAALVQASKDIK